MPPYVEGLVVFGVVYTLVSSAIHIPLLARYLFLPQIGLMLIAAYTSGALAREGLPWSVAAVAGVLASMAGASTIGLLGQRLKDFPLAIAAIAVAEALRLVITSTGILGGVSGLPGIPKAANWEIAFAVLGVALLVLAYYHMSYSSRAAIALGGDEMAARAFGIRPARVKLGISLISGLLCGAGGVLYAAYVGFLNPEFFGFSTLVFILVFTVVGGSRSMWGPLLGVALLWLLPEYLGFLEDYRLIAYSVIVVAIIIAQPGGLAAIITTGARRVRRMLVVLNKKRDTSTPATADPLDPLATHACHGFRRPGHLATHTTSTPPEESHE